MKTTQEQNLFPSGFYIIIDWDLIGNKIPVYAIKTGKIIIPEVFLPINSQSRVIKFGIHI